MDNQHYVPQALLNNSALVTSKSQVYVIQMDLVRLRVKTKGSICLDKEICSKNIKKLCSEDSYLSTKLENFDKKFDLRADL